MAEDKKSENILMEKTWELVQKKTFTKWCNRHLRKTKQRQIENIDTDFEDGITLMHLIKCLYDLEIPKHNPAPKMRPHKLDNISLALEMVDKAKIKTNFLKSNHLADHDTKFILGMVWSIILDYQIKGISVEELNAKEALLLWCQKKTKGYRDVQVDNFTTSWQSGMAFCALIHRHRPDLLNFDTLDKSNRKENLELAFSIAEKELDIPRLLDVEDLTDVPRPDERSVMTYVSEYYHKFAAQDQKETAARRIQKFVQFTRSIQALEASYETDSKTLVAWIDSKIGQMGNVPSTSDLDSAQNLLVAYKTYKGSEKPKYSLKKTEVEALYSNIQTKLSANKRNLYAPAAGCAPADINAAWERLGAAERERERIIRRQITQIKENMQKDFGSLSAHIYAWITAQKEAVITGAQGDLQQQLEFVKAKGSEADSYRHKLGELEAANRRLDEAHIDENPHSEHTLEEVQNAFDQLVAVVKKKQQTLESEILAQSGKAGVTPEQLNEFKETFAHFDKNRDGLLDRNELKACLNALGVIIAENEKAFDNLYGELSASHNGQGADLDTFVDYMIKMIEDTDSAHQIKTSFRLLANEKQSIYEQDLRIHPLQADEIQYLVSNMPSAGSGSYDYATYTDACFA